MDVRHERPIANLEYKVRAPLLLELTNGEVVRVDEWCQSGINFPGNTDVLPKKGFLTIPFQGVDVRFEICFTKGQGPKELNFKNLTGRQREVIGIFYRSILSGKMASAKDMITSLDTPVDLVPMAETDEEKSLAQEHQKPRALRAIVNIVFYFILAAVLFGLIGGQIWDRATSVNFSNGRVVAPKIAHKTKEAAYVETVLVTIGQEVKRGETLVRLTNPDREGDLDDIRRDITRSQAKIQSARNLFKSHLLNFASERAKLSTIYERAVKEKTHYNFIVGANLSTVLSALQAIKDFDNGISIVAGDFHDIQRQLKDQLSIAKETHRRFKRDLSNAKSAARSADIVADRDGVVSDVLVFHNEYLPRGKDVIILEENSARFVRAWVPEERADSIFIGMTTEIRFRSLLGKRSYKGIVSDIVAGIDPTTDNGFGMIITVTLPEFEIEESRVELRANAPVKARGLKEWRFLKWGE